MVKVDLRWQSNKEPFQNRTINWINKRTVHKTTWSSTTTMSTCMWFTMNATAAAARKVSGENGTGKSIAVHTYVCHTHICIHMMVIFDAYACYCIIWFCGVCMSAKCFPFRWFGFWRKRDCTSCSSLFHHLIISNCLCHLLSHGAHVGFSLSNTHVNIRITRASTWQLGASQIARIVYYCLDVCTCRQRTYAFVLEREDNSRTEREASIGEKTSQPASDILIHT